MNRKKRKSEKMRLKRLGMEIFIPPKDAKITTINGILTRSQMKKSTFTRMIEKGKRCTLETS